MLESDQNDSIHLNSKIYSEDENLENLPSFNSLSIISEFSDIKYHHFLCKKCNSTPIVFFIKKGKIKIQCKCQKDPEKLLANKIFDQLFNSEDEIEVIRDYQNGVFGNITIPANDRVMDGVLKGRYYFNLSGGTTASNWPGATQNRTYLRCIRELSAAEIEKLNGFDALIAKYQAR